MRTRSPLHSLILRQYHTSCILSRRLTEAPRDTIPMGKRKVKAKQKTRFDRPQRRARESREPAAGGWWRCYQRRISHGAAKTRILFVLAISRSKASMDSASLPARFCHIFDRRQVQPTLDNFQIEKRQLPHLHNIAEATLTSLGKHELGSPSQAIQPKSLPKVPPHVPIPVLHRWFLACVGKGANTDLTVPPLLSETGCWAARRNLQSQSYLEPQP